MKVAETHEARSYYYLLQCLAANAGLINKYTRLLQARACLCSLGIRGLFEDKDTVLTVKIADYFAPAPAPDSQTYAMVT